MGNNGNNSNLECGDDKFLSKMEHIINRWINVPQSVYIVDRENTIKPHFISLTYREKNIETITIINGSSVDQNGGSLVQDAGFSLYVMIGDNKQGYGASRSARENVPRRPNTLAGLIDISMDAALKYALKSYMVSICNKIGVETKNGFNKLSSDETYISIEKKPAMRSLDETTQSLLKRWSKKLTKKDYISENKVGIKSTLNSRRFVDSEGRIIRDYNLTNAVTIGAIINHNNGFEIPYSVNIISGSSNGLKKGLDEKLEKFCLHSEKLVNAEIPECNQYPVLFGGGALGTIFHEAIGGHLLSGKYILDGRSSTFKDKIGQQILPEFITIKDNPLMQGSHGFYRFDDEGIKAEPINLVENGVLKNYLLDRDSAGKMGVSSNGRSRMEWVCAEDLEDGSLVSLLPEPRVSNLEVISSNTVSESALFENMMKYCKDNHIEYGIYIDGGDGSVRIETSEFYLMPEKAWKVYPNGKRKEIINFFVVGKPYEILSQIAVTSNNYSASSGFCGSNSGNVPTRDIAPSAFIPRITIQSAEPVKLSKRLLEREMH